jgi:hypothetical protein
MDEAVFADIGHSFTEGGELLVYRCINCGTEVPIDTIMELAKRAVKHPDAPPSNR